MARKKNKSIIIKDPLASRRFKIFLSDLKSVRGLADASIEAVDDDILSLCDFLGQGSYSQDVEHWKEENLLAYIQEQSKQKKASATIVRRMASIRLYCRFARSQNWLHTEPEKAFVRHKMPQILAETLSIEDVEQVLAATQHTNTPLRDKAIVELLYGSGLRVSELAGLIEMDVDIERLSLFVRGKGDKDRYSPLSEPAKEALQEYRDKERPLLTAKKSGSPSPKLFLNKKGEAISRQSLYAVLKNLGKLAGLKSPLHPHVLRHCYATHLLDGGADLRIVQVLLGHSCVSTTERYIHTQSSRLREKFERWHPRS